MNDTDIPDTPVSEMNYVHIPKKGSVKMLRPFLERLFKYNEGLTTISDGCDTDSLHIRGYVNSFQLEKLINQRWLMVFIHADSTLCVTVLPEVTI